MHPYSRARRLFRTGSLVVIAGSAGAVLSHFYDPDRGRARRARLRDQGAARARHARRAAGRRVNYAEGRLRGLQYRATHVPDRTTPDDVTLAQKIRSEVLGDARFRGSNVHVDAVDGVVHLRGELGSPVRINELIAAVERVGGVKRIESYLHLPGRPSPNKVDALRADVHTTP